MPDETRQPARARPALRLLVNLGWAVLLLAFLVWLLLRR